MKISLAAPVYNESSKIVEFIERSISSLKNISEDIEIVLVNDCSTDDTSEKIKNLLPNYPFIRLINLTQNSGQHIATSIALQHATGDYIFMIDSDLQVNPEYMLDLYNFGKSNAEWDIISAQRIDRSRKISRRLSSKVVSILLQRVGKSRLKDIGSTFKLIKRKALTRILAQDILIQNLPILMMNLNLKIFEYPIQYNVDQARKSHYGFFDLISAITLALLNFSTGGSTLIVLLVFGVLLLFLGIFFVLGLIIWGMVNQSELPTNMLLFSIMMSIIGIQLLLLSMVVFKLERINKNLDFRRVINQKVDYDN